MLVDLDDEDALHARKPGAEPKSKPTFGHESITVGGTDDNVSRLYAAHCVSAGEYAVPEWSRLRIPGQPRTRPVTVRARR